MGEATGTVHFVNALAEMKSHYLGGAQQMFTLEASPHVQQLRALAVGSDAPGDDVQAQLTQIKTDGRTDLQAAVGQQQQAATAASTQVQQDKNQESFKQKMEKQKAKAKADSDATIDKAYAAAEKLGTANPNQQDAILNGMNSITTAFTGVINGLVTAVSTVIDAVVKFITGILGPLEGVAQAFAPVLGLLAVL